MKVRPDDWPDVVEGEDVAVLFQLGPVISPLTVTAVSFECEPSGGVTFSNETFALDSNRTVGATMTAARAGEYVVLANCTLSNGTTRKPRARQRVVCEGEM